MCFRSTEGFLGLLDKYMKQVEAEEERRRNEGVSGSTGPGTSLLSRAGTMKSILSHHMRAGNLGGPEGVSIERPIFVVECTFIPSEGHQRRGVYEDQYSRLEFSPSGQDFRVFIEESLMESLRAVSSCPSFLALPEFQPFIAPLAEVATPFDLPTTSSSSTVSVVANNEQLREVLSMISNRVENLFQKVMDYTETYQRFVEMYDRNEGVNIEEEFGPQSELAVYRDGLVKYRTEQQLIAAMEPQKEIGLFRVDAEAFQKILKPNPVKCLEKLQRYIPEMAMARIHDLSEQLKEANEKLGHLPTNVEEFVHFTTYLGNLTGTSGKGGETGDGTEGKDTKEVEEVTAVEDGMRDDDSISLQVMEGRQQDVADLMELVKEFNIKITTKQRTAFMELSQTLSSLRNQIEFSQENTEANINRFIKELDHEIPVMLDCVTKGFDKLKDSQLSDESLASFKEGREEVLAALDEIDAHVEAVLKDSQRINDYQEALKVEVTPFEKVDELKVLFNSVSRMWRSLEEWEQTSEEWLQWRFGLVDVDKISKEVAVYQKVAMQSVKQLETNAVAASFTSKVTAFKNTLPVVMALRNSALKERHWTEIHEIIGVELDLESDELTLGALLGMGVDKSMEQIQEISGRAGAEQSLEEMLDKVKRVWEDLELVVNPYKDSKEVFILGSVDDVITALEDSLVNISTISGSRFVGPIRDEVEEWQKNLMLFQETLDEWLAVQRNWVYLESIFSAGDIKKQLPIESAKFMEIDQHWRNIMKDTNDYSVALVAATKPGRLEQFKEFNETLDQIQKSLEEYLHSKRKAFPRFFFLSNDELLEILAQARRVQAVQPHLRKCFDNLVKLRFGGDDDDKNGGGASAGAADIVGMISSEGEEIPFFKVLKARGNVEKWLLEVEEYMVKSMHAVMKKGFIDYPEQPRKEWVAEKEAQVVSCVGMIMWCAETERILQGKDKEKVVDSMRIWYQRNVTQLEELTDLVRSKLSSIQRRSVVALVTQDVHNRDIIEDLAESNVVSTSSFKWQQQLRYYWDAEEDDCIVNQVDAVIRYGYEYQGATTRLVITPLTDRCWMTITGALHIKLGAAPAGPAGTGKTESTKDLAKALARQCVVFNCSDQIDYKMMGKLYSGVVTAGAWTCLDEFNRISIEVLSVIAQQLLTIRVALLNDQQEFMFEGFMLRLKPTCGVFITMNPGYAGRTELPDNLKVLFRPMSMMVPDYTLIAEIMLFAEGFSTAKRLSGKFTKLYKLSSEQLSKQDHYDFGMRAVKSVLVMAGSLKRSDPDLNEDVLLIRAMRDSNVPKFLAADLPLFYAIVGDLFPGVEVPYIDYGVLREAVDHSVKSVGLQVVDAQAKKVIQLYETFNVRFGVMLVGPTTGGKTVIYRTLAKALTKLKEDGHADENYQTVRYDVLNPKCITMGELYGEFNELTQEWTDGLGSSLMRANVADETQDWRWTVFDGPVDAIWIESMNTVLDDNMTLCLANGERIKLKPEMRMLFEVQDLAVASPATVSRCGMVYVDPLDLGWRPFACTWLYNHLPEGPPYTSSVRSKIWDLMERHLDPAIAWIRRNSTEPVTTVDPQLIYSFCHLFEAILSWEASTRHGAASSDCDTEKNPMVDLRKIDPSDEESAKLLDKIIQGAFCFAMAWSIGGSCDTKSRQLFAQYCEQEFESISFPRGGSVYDGYVDLNKGSRFLPWEDLVPKFSYKETDSYLQLLVPNVDSVRFSYVVDKMLTQQKSVFLTGMTGVGKSVILGNLLDKMKVHSKVVPVAMTLSAQSNASRIQLTIEGKLEKKRKTLLGAPVNKSIVILVDDVNMPAVEEYGAQPPIELLRLMQDLGGFYDRKKLFWKDVENTTLLLCAAPPGGGRNEMTPRFTRHSMVLCMPNTSNDAMSVIFSSIVNGFFTTYKFKPDVQALVNSMVGGTIEFYEKISIDLLPTPAKSHYLFNLRDVSKVFQGVLMARPASCNSADKGVRLWIHEMSRVFYDRLINEEDRKWYVDTLMKLVKVKFRADNLQASDVFGDTPLMWGDFLRPGSDNKVYEEITDLAKMARILEDFNDEYNLTHSTPMNLVFFKDAMEHVAHISRVLRQERGNLLLVGVGGSGRQSLTRLSASMAEMGEFEIELTKGYGVDQFREDEKAFLMGAGSAEGKQTLFLLNDTQIISETFLEDINNVLNAGEVPNLFPSDEMDRIIGDLRPVAKENNRSEAKDAVWNYFIERIKGNLHIVLAMSPVGDALRIRMRMFPSLVNCTTVDWFHPWPDDALSSVATRFLEKIEALDDAMKANLAQECVVVHQSVLRWSEVFLERLRRHVYSTPKSYLDLIHLYTEMLSEKRDEKMRVQKRLVVGLDKLKEANSVVSSLQEELTALQPILAQKKVETDELIIVVTEERKKADEVAAKVASEEAVVREQAETVQAIQADAQKDLDVAMPALDKAIKSLDALDKKDITEIKSFPKPPALVMMTMEAVNTLLGEKPDWDTAKRVLSDSQFMTKLKEYDKDNIPPNVLKKLEKYIQKPEYAPDSVGNQSKAAKSLCMWTHAMDTYSKVAKTVEPKKKRLEEMNKQLAEATEILTGKQNDLKAIQDKVAALKQKLDDTEAEKDRLIKEAELTQARLQRAEVLTVGLAGESVRWKETVEKMDAEIEALTGDVFLSAAAISYFGPFTGQYRREVVGEWLTNMQRLGIPCSEAFSLVGVMGNPVQVREWNLQGLPSDSVSLDNGVLVTRGKRWPLMIDPQEQANKWIKKKEGGGGSSGQLQLLKLGNPKLLLIVENAIRMGNPLLIEDIGETLDPSLEPVLQKAVFNNNGRLQIHLGDSDVDYNPDFRFYMTTKLPNPHYYPEVCIKVGIKRVSKENGGAPQVTVINFTVTFEGLGEQLLTLVVESELPEVMRRKTELMMQLDKDKKTLQGLEDEILRLLSESQGNILDDEVLISTLQQSKITAKEIEERVADAEVTKVEIEAACNKYLSVSERGSILYFVVADLANIDPMYQFSLFYFVRMFMYTIHNAEKSDDLDTRLKTLITDITEYVFKLVCRGLFEVHKLIFSFLIQTQIDRHAGHIQNAEWGLLLRGVGIQDVSGRPNNPDVDLIPEKQWQLLFAVQQLVPQLGDICSHITKNIDPWRRWCCEEDPHLVDLPENYENTRPVEKKTIDEGEEDKDERKRKTAELSYFRKLLILKCLCPEKVLFGVGEYVKRTLGEKYCVFATPMMEDVFADSSHTTPIIFVLSTGADPTQMLLRFAHAEDYESKLHIISLGQGQGPRAQKLMERGYEEGLWVLLQNCHLAKSWMPTLQRLVEAMEGNALISHQFRLFLTSMPADYFPVPILQISVKLTTEPPKGLRANVKRSLISLDDESLNKSRKAPAWRRLQFSLKLFHAVIQERRKFGPLGWNIRYEFNDSDLETSTVILHNMLELEDPEIPWDTITFVVGQINYGGRVTDDWDRRCLMATLGRFVNPNIMEKDDYPFSASGIYRLPDGVDEIAVASFRQYVDSLPLSEAPEIFGMHDNANISFQQQESDVILNTVLSIQPRESGGGGGRSADEIVYELATQMIERLPAPITEESACAGVFAVNEQGMMGSLGTCLSQEMSRFNKLIGRMKKTLTELQKAIKGLIVMTADLDAMFSALQNNYIPSLWEAVAYPSLKPLASWFEDMISRVEFFRDWVINDQPVAYWISAFYFPQGFLTAVLQAYSRFYMVPVDVLGFEFIVQDFDDPLNEVDEPPTEGCLVYGLYMDGCRWDYEDMVLEDQDPGVMYVNAPTIHFVPCKNYKVDPDQYSCPLYKTSVRAGTLSTTGHSTNFVLAIEMDTNKPKDHWVLRGAALLTMLND